MDIQSDTLEAALRAVIIYAFTLLIIRLGSKRMMGKATAFDVILGIMIGSVMSRAINSSDRIVPTLVAGSVMVAMHWLFGVVAFHTDWFGRVVKGIPVRLIEDGTVRDDAMRQSHISRRDLDEALRHQGIQPDPSRVELAHLERDGTISVIKRDGAPRVLDVHVANGVQTVRIELS